MNPSEGGLEHRRLRAPQADGQRLIEPPLEFAAEAVAKNIQERVSSPLDFGGRSWPDLARQARTEMVAAAQRYLDLPASVDPARPLLLSGHQPDLYHPGVWFKNFVVARLAQQLNAESLVLQIDNDLARSPFLRVPTGSLEDPQLDPLPFDRAQEVVPHEERRILDPELFDRFGERACRSIEPLVAEPLIRDLWESAPSFRARFDRLGECLSAIRRHAEHSFGVRNLEVPLSQICEHEPFRWFVVYLLSRLPEFHAVHNQSLLEYRRVNRIRSQTHPVPALQAQDDWLEAPLWIWTESDPRRRAVFVRRVGSDLELTDFRELKWRVPLGDGAQLAAAAGQLLDVEPRPKLRPRALITTMYARLFLSDLFVHGIGGAKYDELTDVLLLRFLQVPAPPFLVATATARLPISRPAVDEARPGQLQTTLRQMYYQPDRFVDSTAGSTSLVDEKRRWIDTELPRGQRKQRHTEITRINASLRELVEPQRQRLLKQHQEAQQDYRRDRLLASREFSFCLFPRKTLQALLLDF